MEAFYFRFAKFSQLVFFQFQHLLSISSCTKTGTNNTRNACHLSKFLYGIGCTRLNPFLFLSLYVVVIFVHLSFIQCLFQWLSRTTSTGNLHTRLLYLPIQCLFPCNGYLFFVFLFFIFLLFFPTTRHSHTATCNLFFTRLRQSSATRANYLLPSYHLILSLPSPRTQPNSRRLKFFRFKSLSTFKNFLDKQLRPIPYQMRRFPFSSSAEKQVGIRNWYHINIADENLFQTYFYLLHTKLRHFFITL